MNKFEWDYEEDEKNQKKLYILELKYFKIFYLSENDPDHNKELILFKNYPYINDENNFKKIKDKSTIKNIINDIYTIKIILDTGSESVLYSYLLKKYNIDLIF